MLVSALATGALIDASRWTRRNFASDADADHHCLQLLIATLPLSTTSQILIQKDNF